MLGYLECASRFYSILLFSLPAPRREPSAELLAELREGGYVLFLRHTSTDFSQNDSRMTSFEDCATQRNLTDKGRAEARALGEHVKRLKIPIGEVLASPFCRTMETARLAFGKARATNEVRGGPLSADDPKRYEPLSKLLGTQARRRHEHRALQPRQSLPRRGRPALPRRGRDRRGAPGRRRALQRGR